MALVRGLHGLHGTVRVEVLTDHPEGRLAPGAQLYPEGAAAPLTVAEASPVADGPGWWLTFREVAGRAAAERLRDRYLEVEVDPASDLAPGQAYWHEVIGAAVLGQGGRSLGRVADVYRVGESEVYVVRGGPVGEFDLPAVHGIITDFSPRDGQIAVDEAALNLGDPEAERPRRERRPPRWSRHGKGGTAG
ncbi:MAG TPA: ribosome maturation factor RimM [Candidatus Limnocylindrales bacterium]|nr:ribosome maturation factor RimM [Candidatus Limnocylindrales bacterium]